MAHLVVSVATKRAGPSKAGGVAFVIALFGAALTTGERLRDLADDPIDEDHMEVPEPVPIDLPEIVEDDTEVVKLRKEIIQSGWPQHVVDVVSLFEGHRQGQEELLGKATSRLNNLPPLAAGHAAMFNDPVFALREAEVVGVLREFVLGE